MKILLIVVCICYLHHRGSGQLYKCGVREVRQAFSNERTTRESQSDLLSLLYTLFGSKQIMQIVWGKEVKQNSWLWMAAVFKEGVQYDGGFIGGGTLISDRYVMSAAHLFRDNPNPSSIIIRLGSHKKTDAKYVYRVQRIVCHPDFKVPNIYNDICLLELEKPVDFNKMVFPVCLPPNKNYCDESQIVGKSLTILGWGDVKYGTPSSVLRDTTVQVLSRASCEATYKKLEMPQISKGITEQVICAGTRGKDACRGDSGGPLMMKQGEQWIQIGVVSFGKDCAVYPGLYMNVCQYLDWIKQVTGIQVKN